jgi:hypothetical protein
MTPEDQEKMDKHLASVITEIKNPEFFDHFTLETLNNFAYRYFENATAAQKISITPHCYQVSALEYGIKDAIKIPDSSLREGIKQLLLKYPPAQVSLERRFRVEFTSAEAGQVKVSAALSFGHPDHQYQAKSFVQKTTTFEYSEFLILRNRLAGLLEEVAELYG